MARREVEPNKGCALNDDGFLKDADQISFAYSASEEVCLNPNGTPSRHGPGVGRRLRSRHVNSDRTPAVTRQRRKATSKVTKSKKAAPRNGRIESEGSETHSGEDEVSSAEIDDTDDERVEYLATRRHAEDEQKLNVRSSDKRTADIRTVFTKATLEVNGKATKGNICEICKESGLSDRQAFMLGSSSSLRTHVSRAEGHLGIYLERCRKSGVEPNHRARPAAKKGADQEVARIALIPKWSRDGLLDHIIQMIIESDDAFNVVERESFRRLLQYQRPQTGERDIPHRTLLRQEIMSKALRVSKHTKKRLASVPGQISATFDAWTSRAGDAFLSFTIHYITAPSGNPNEWCLKNEVLAMPHLEGGHSGANQGDIILRVIEQYGLGDKIGWITTDNATANDSAMQHIETRLPPFRRHRWIAGQRRVRCVEHELHLAARHFIEKVSPTPAHILKKRLNTKLSKRSRAKSDNDDNDDSADGHNDNEDNEIWRAECMEAFDDDNMEPTGECADPKVEAKAAAAVAEDDGEEDVEFDPGDVIGKALALIKLIRKSPDARGYLRTLCEREQVPTIQLASWVRTHWASMHHLFGCMLKIRPALDQFIRLADDSSLVPVLQKKNYLDYKLEKGEWTLIKLMHSVLQEPVDCHMRFAYEDHPTVGFTIPYLEYIQTRWEALLKDADFAPVHAGIRAGLENLRKWYCKLDDSDVHFVCLALNPATKLEYTKKRWGKQYHLAAVAKLEELFDDYYEDKPVEEPGMLEDAPKLGSPKKGIDWGADWMNVTAQAESRRTNTSVDRRQELHNYIKAPLDSSCRDIVKWWALHQELYPTLSCIAQDYLAIQGSSVASERLFSSAGLAGTDRRNRLSPVTFEALQILKSAYKNKMISASEEAAAHVGWPEGEMVTDENSPF